MITANRYHDISFGHRVYGHENKCAHLHGHNYRFTFYVEPFPYQTLDKVGRVMDFGVIKKYLCTWLEANYDHKMLIWVGDPAIDAIRNIDPHGLCQVEFNPTAENIAEDFVVRVAPSLLAGTGVRLKKLVLEETRKCSVTYEL